MKTLVLFRHAKSSWADAALSDIERPLNKRGLRDAPEMGRRLAVRGFCPDVMITSPARRARQTAAAVAAALDYPEKHIVVAGRLYGADLAGWLETIEGLDDGADSVVLFGHNPALTEVARRLLPFAVDNVPTAGVVTLTYGAAHWKGITRRRPSSADWDYPKKPTPGHPRR